MLGGSQSTRLGVFKMYSHVLSEEETVSHIHTHHDRIRLIPRLFF